MIPLASNAGEAKQGAGNKLPLFARDSEALMNLQRGAFSPFSFFVISSHNNGAFSTLLL